MKFYMVQVRSTSPGSLWVFAFCRQFLNAKQAWEHIAVQDTFGSSFELRVVQVQINTIEERSPNLLPKDGV